MLDLMANINGSTVIFSDIQMSKELTQMAINTDDDKWDIYNEW